MIDEITRTKLPDGSSTPVGYAMRVPWPAGRAVGRALEPLDRWLAGLRGVTLVGGMAWWLLQPLAPESSSWVVWLFAAFAAYSLALYGIHARCPALLTRLYRAAMILDLGFILALVRVTGGMASDVYLGLYLLIALHAFYFGLATGAGLAIATGALYVLADGWPPPIEVSDLGLRVGLFLLVGVCMGGLAEREGHKRRQVEELARDLQEQQERAREAQEQLIRSDRLATVGELAAGLAHELRNPLTGVSGALRVLAGELPPDSPYRSLLADIQDQIARMNKTLTDLLWHARPPTPQYLPLNVNEVIDQSLWFLPMASGSRIEVVREYEPELPRLRLDPSLLHQAFLNILVNARQAMPSGGRLTVRSSRYLDATGCDGDVEVSIADTGIGIPVELRPQIFEPFFTTKVQGTGLGLAIAAQIIKQHGGRIAVDSTPGRGTVFRITLPVPADDRTWRPHDGVEASRR